MGKEENKQHGSHCWFLTEHWMGRHLAYPAQEQNSASSKAQCKCKHFWWSLLDLYSEFQSWMCLSDVFMLLLITIFITVYYLGVQHWEYVVRCPEAKLCRDPRSFSQAFIKRSQFPFWISFIPPLFFTSTVTMLIQVPIISYLIAMSPQKLLTSKIHDLTYEEKN